MEYYFSHVGPPCLCTILLTVVSSGCGPVYYKEAFLGTTTWVNVAFGFVILSSHSAPSFLLLLIACMISTPLTIALYNKLSPSILKITRIHDLFGISQQAISLIFFIYIWILYSRCQVQASFLKNAVYTELKTILLQYSIINNIYVSDSILSYLHFYLQLFPK